MGLHRDLVWFRTATGVHFTGAIAQNSLSMINLSADATTYVKDGESPGDNMRLRGRITHLMLSLDMATSLPLKVVFYANRTGPTSNPNTDRLLDYESIIAPDWFTFNGATKPRKVVKSGLDLPYFDAGNRKEFHVGIQNTATTAIGAKKIVLEFAWRADLGVHT